MLPSALLRDRKTVLLRRGVPIALGGVLITGGGMAYAGHGDSGPAYRTAAASVGEVDQLVTLTGTVAKLTREDASFGVSGTVKKVEVAPGDKVTVGDTLAELDTTDLDAAVTAAKATLAKAKAQLETDEAADDTSSSATSSSSSSGSGSKSSTATPSPSSSPTTATGGKGTGGAGRTGTGGTGTTAGTTVGGVDLATPTNAVVTALAKATADLQQATTLISARDSACATVLNGGSGDSTPGPDPSPSATQSGSPTGSPTDTPTEQPTDTPSDSPTPATETSVRTSDSSPSDDLQSCITAMKAVSDMQDQINTDQIAVQTKETALKAAMDQAVAALKAQATSGTDTSGTDTSGTGTSGTGTSGTGITGTGSTGNTETKGGSTTGGSKTGTGTTGTTGGSGATGSSGGGRQQTLDPVDQAARIAVDNASILAAQAALDSANEDVDEAVLTAPIDGVVGTVGITKGAGASTSNTITVLGNGAVKVTLEVPQATAAKLKKGMTAKVIADGASAPSDGVVDSIGIMPSTSNGTSTYPVVVVVNSPADGLAEGAAATVAITLKAVSDAVTVPNSAVTATGTGSDGFVTLLQNGKTTRQAVTTGAVGTTVTQIVSGVTAGQTVVLADTAADVPASSTTANNNRGFGGNFGGGNFGGGNFGGGNFGGGNFGGGAVAVVGGGTGDRRRGG